MRVFWLVSNGSLWVVVLFLGFLATGAPVLTRRSVARQDDKKATAEKLWSRQRNRRRRRKPLPPGARRFASKRGDQDP
jgi:hypothetical protein